MSRSVKVPVLVLAATLALALAGCSTPASTGTSASQSSAPETTTSAEPSEAAPEAAGETVTGTGYSFTVPEGWADPGEDVSAQGVDLIVADLTDTDGFADNVNVVLSPAGEVTPDQVESAGVSELENAGATDVTVRDRVTVAGAESAHLAAIFTASGAEYQIEQYYLTNAGQTYVVTFSFSTTVSETDRDALSDSVLATWTWA